MTSALKNITLRPLYDSTPLDLYLFDKYQMELLAAVEKVTNPLFHPLKSDGTPKEMKTVKALEATKSPHQTIQLHLMNLLILLFRDVSIFFDENTFTWNIHLFGPILEKESFKNLKFQLTSLLDYFKSFNISLQIDAIVQFTRFSRPSLFAFLDQISPVVTQLELMVLDAQFHLPPRLLHLKELRIQFGRLLPEEIRPLEVPYCNRLTLNNIKFYQGAFQALVRKMSFLTDLTLIEIKENFGLEEIALIADLKKLKSWIFRPINKDSLPLTSTSPRLRLTAALIVWKFRKSDLSCTNSCEELVRELLRDLPDQLPCVELICQSIQYQCPLLLKTATEKWNLQFADQLILSEIDGELWGTVQFPCNPLTINKDIKIILKSLTGLTVIQTSSQSSIELPDYFTSSIFQLRHLCLKNLSSQNCLTLWLLTAPTHRVEIFGTSLIDFPPGHYGFSLESFTLSQCRDIPLNFFERILMTSKVMSLELVDCSFENPLEMAKNLVRLFPSLENVSLSRCQQVSNEWIPILAQKWTNLVRLDLSYTAITAKALDPKIFLFLALNSLSLEGTSIGDKGLQALTQVERHITNLNVDRCGIHEKGFSSLKTHMPLLRKISCQNNSEISAAALNDIAAGALLLTELDIRGCPNLPPESLTKLLLSCPQFSSILMDPTPKCSYFTIQRLRSPPPADFEIDQDSLTGFELYLLALHQRTAENVRLIRCKGLDIVHLERALFSSALKPPYQHLYLKLHVEVDKLLQFIICKKLQVQELTIVGEMGNVTGKLIEDLLTNCPSITRLRLAHLAPEQKKWPLTYSEIKLLRSRKSSSCLQVFLQGISREVIQEQGPPLLDEQTLVEIVLQSDVNEEKRKSNS